MLFIIYNRPFPNINPKLFIGTTLTVQGVVIVTGHHRNIVHEMSLVVQPSEETVTYAPITCCRGNQVAFFLFFNFVFPLATTDLPSRDYSIVCSRLSGDYNYHSFMYIFFFTSLHVLLHASSHKENFLFCCYCFLVPAIFFGCSPNWVSSYFFFNFCPTYLYSIVLLRYTYVLIAIKRKSYILILIQIMHLDF